MHQAVDILESAAGRDATGAFAVTQRAIASATKVIMRADDSSGVIGDACRRLLDLHARLAPLAKPPAAKLVDWMIAFPVLQRVRLLQHRPRRLRVGARRHGRGRLPGQAGRDRCPAGPEARLRSAAELTALPPVVRSRALAAASPGRRRVEVLGVQVLVVVEIAVGDAGAPT